MGDRHEGEAFGVSVRMSRFAPCFRAFSTFAGGVLLPVLAGALEPGSPDRTSMIGIGRSMLPTLSEFCRIAVVRVPFDEVKAGGYDGDIIATWLNGRCVVHRAIERRPDGSLVTQGDNNPEPDPFVTTERNYVGVVVGFERPGTVGERVAPVPKARVNRQ